MICAFRLFPALIADLDSDFGLVSVWCRSELQIRHDLLHCLDVGSVCQNRLSELSLPLGALLGQDVALIGFKSHKFAGACQFEALCSCSLSFHLGHSIYLLCQTWTVIHIRIIPLA